MGPPPARCPTTAPRLLGKPRLFGRMPSCCAPRTWKLIGRSQPRSGTESGRFHAKPTGEAHEEVTGGECACRAVVAIPIATVDTSPRAVRRAARLPVPYLHKPSQPTLVESKP